MPPYQYTHLAIRLQGFDGQLLLRAAYCVSRRTLKKSFVTWRRSQVFAVDREKRLHQGNVSVGTVKQPEQSSQQYWSRKKNVRKPGAPPGTSKDGKCLQGRDSVKVLETRSLFGNYRVSSRASHLYCGRFQPGICLISSFFANACLTGKLRKKSY
jgi:hypothetical protein